MGQDNGTAQPNNPAFWRDPRLYQIASLSTLLLYGLFWLPLRHLDLTDRHHTLRGPTDLIRRLAQFQPPLLRPQEPVDFCPVPLPPIPYQRSRSCGTGILHRHGSQDLLKAEYEVLCGQGKPD